MQSPEGEHEAACPNEARPLRSFRARYGPLALLLTLFALLDFFVPFMARQIAGVESESFESAGLTDGSGAVLSVDLTTPASEIYLLAALSSTFLAAVAQQAVLAVWAVFGAGRWPVRIAIIIGASAACYALVETQLLRGFNDWRIAAQGIAPIPLRLAGMILPLAAWRIWSGRRLMHSVDPSPPHDSIAVSRRRFAIRDLLWVTAYVAIAVALIRWTATPPGVDNQRSEVVIAVLSLMTLIWAAVYVMPLAWGLLAPHRSHRALIFGSIYAALWFIVPAGFILKNNPSGGDLGFVIGLVVGSSFVVPASFLIWRWCGWRLT